MSSISNSEYPKLSIIAMKGYPFTRKTEFAEIVAKSLCCPVLSSDDILINLRPPISPEKEFEAFEVISRIAFQQLHSGIFKNVVIDSPLSSPSHFIHLTLSTSRSFRFYSKRVIVIECIPTHNYSWKLMFQQKLAYQSKPWYRPKTWEQVEKYIKEHPDYDVTSVSSTPDLYVSKLVLDPLLDIPFQNPLYGSPVGTGRLVEAVKYMMRRDRGDGPDVVVYRQWLQQSLSSSLTPLGEEHCWTHGHDIVPDSKAVPGEGTQDETTVDCMFCERRVTRSYNTGNSYCYCKNCSFTLHMECALSSKRDYARRRFAQIHSRKLENIPCTHTVEFMECKACELNNLLQTPTAIKHVDTKEHFLTILLLDEEEVYRCFACGQNNNKGNMYLCKDCGFTYHYECVTMPRRVKNVHGGHHHLLSLKFESEEEEDYICQECQGYRDPALWYYSCEECPGYELHPSCVAKLRLRNGAGVYKGWMDKKEIEAAEKIQFQGMKMKESESISDFYSRVVYLVQWYGDLRMEEAEVFDDILYSLPLKFYHIIVAIKRSEEYESMTVDQLMIYLRVYEKRIDNGEDVSIEQVLANLFATQRSSSRKNCNKCEDDKLIMNAKDVSLKSVLRTDYSAQESGDNWIKYWKRYWDKYWFNYQRGYYRKGKSQVQCSICKMFGHYPRRCWSVSKKAKKKLVKIKFLIQSCSSQWRSIAQSPATFCPSSEIECRVFKD